MEGCSGERHDEQCGRIDVLEWRDMAFGDACEGGLKDVDVSAEVTIIADRDKKRLTSEMT